MVSDASGRQAELHWLALHLVSGLGARNALKLIRTFGSPERVFHASLTELRAGGLRQAVAEEVHSGTSFEDATAEQGKVKEAGVEVVSIHDPRYPRRLKEIYDPPILLYAKGRAAFLDAENLGVVGSRRPTPYGMAVARKLSRELTQIGITIVSGMARGIDSYAHQGALEAGGPTVAVLGCGVDVIYPRENKKLAVEIAEKGVIVSEFPMGSTAFPQNFPIRNRVISGLSIGVMVVEGAQYSGSLITARLALDQSREVFAVPGSIVSKPSWGPNLLIKQGAKLVQQASDVVEDLPLDVKETLARRQEEKDSAASETASGVQASLWEGSTTPLAKRLLPLLQIDQSMHIDDIIRRCEQNSASEILAALSELELFGLARQLPGKHFVRIWIS